MALSVAGRVEVAMARLPELTGTPLGPSRPVLMNQQRITTFADATEDHQWIHTDPVKASSGPFGGTVAHGFLTLSLLATILEQLICVTDAGLAVNYGLNKVRFPQPVPVDTNVIGSGQISGVAEVPHGIQVGYNIELSGGGQTKPFCVAEYIVRYYEAQP